jgi:hypothetical protein
MVAGQDVREVVADVAAEHGARYATIYPAEDDWPPPWAEKKPRSSGRTRKRFR